MFFLGTVVKIEQLQDILCGKKSGQKAPFVRFFFNPKYLEASHRHLLYSHRQLAVRGFLLVSKQAPSPYFLPVLKRFDERDDSIHDQEGAPGAECEAVRRSWPGIRQNASTPGGLTRRNPHGFSLLFFWCVCFALLLKNASLSNRVLP